MMGIMDLKGFKALTGAILTLDIIMIVGLVLQLMQKKIVDTTQFGYHFWNKKVNIMLRYLYPKD